MHNHFCNTKYKDEEIKIQSVYNGELVVTPAIRPEYCAAASTPTFVYKGSNHDSLRPSLKC